MPINPAQGKKAPRPATNSVFTEQPSDIDDLEAFPPLSGSTTLPSATELESARFFPQDLETASDDLTEEDLKALPVLAALFQAPEDDSPSQGAESFHEVFSGQPEHSGLGITSPNSSGGQPTWASMMDEEDEQSQQLHEVEHGNKPVTPEEADPATPILAAQPNFEIDSPAKPSGSPIQQDIDDMLASLVDQLDDTAKPLFNALLRLNTHYSNIQAKMINSIHALEARVMITEKKLTVSTRENKALLVENAKIRGLLDSDRAALNHRLDRIKTSSSSGSGLVAPVVPAQVKKSTGQTIATQKRQKNKAAFVGEQ